MRIVGSKSMRKIIYWTINILLLCISIIAICLTVAMIVYMEKNDKKSMDYMVEVEVEPVDVHEQMEAVATTEQIDNGYKISDSIVGSDKEPLEELPLIDSSITDPLQVTDLYNARDKAIISKYNNELSNVKISILGDSLTEGYPMEIIKEDNFPNDLSKILNCEVKNLGITGSTISKYYDREPMCNRWNEIDDDSDIIIVYAGTNDMMLFDKAHFGTIGQEGTFCGDLDSMLKNIAENYPNSRRILINPSISGLCGALYECDPDNLYEQYVFSNEIRERAIQYQYELIDLYADNILSTTTVELCEKYYMEDCLHLNQDGYRVLAEHVAAKIIRKDI